MGRVLRLSVGRTRRSRGRRPRWTRRSRGRRPRRAHRSELFLSRRPAPAPSRTSSLTLNLRSRFGRMEQRLHRRTQSRPEREPGRPPVVRRLDRRSVALGRRVLQEHHRSFVNRGGRYPRTRRPTSVPLTLVPKFHRTATHHGRGRRPPPSATCRRRGDLGRPSAIRRGGLRLRLSATHPWRDLPPHPGAIHRMRDLPPHPSSTLRGRALPPHPSANPGGSGAHLPDSGTGSAASRPLTRVIRVRRRTSPP
jgi:hypothetical protein